ncbi:hypothetical protein [Bacillus sp. UNCCL81]|uniref:hypothetical protein n=1 Tax=Bacillus sp. UNCCL81 TaxID=1502755 RepID=UPI0008EE1800|nr:hypothetical protein [Bacillus sp. UNCCL81]SFC53089.1 hypothetical protein SAMN02799633_01113 [Bacillus sp. UNCCL81]
MLNKKIKNLFRKEFNEIVKDTQESRNEYKRISSEIAEAKLLMAEHSKNRRLIRNK